MDRDLFEVELEKLIVSAFEAEMPILQIINVLETSKLALIVMMLDKRYEQRKETK